MASLAQRLEYDQKKAPLFKSRHAIVNGTEGARPHGVPGFWLQAFQNNMILAEEVSKQDEEVY